MKIKKFFTNQLILLLYDRHGVSLEFYIKMLTRIITKDWIYNSMEWVIGKDGYEKSDEDVKFDWKVDEIK